MLNYYQEVTLRSDGEFPVYFLRNTVITKLHKALHDSQQSSIGVSFPNYKVKLGDTIRLHGDKASLQTLQDSNWLGGLAGYCEVDEILAVPESIKGYRTISRKQPTMTLKKLEKRVKYQEANGVLKTAEDIKSYERQYKEKMYGSHSLDNPYLELQSASSGQRYRVFIKMGEIQDKPVTGNFNHFGLSKSATVPWF